MFAPKDFSLVFRSQLPTFIQLVIASLLAHSLSQNDYGVFNLLKNIIIMSYALVNFSFERTALSLHHDYSLQTITRNIIPIRSGIFLLLCIPVALYTLSVDVVPALIVLTLLCIAPAIADIKYSFDIGQVVEKDVSLVVFRAAPLLLLIPTALTIEDGGLILYAHFGLLLAGYLLYIGLQHTHIPGLLGKPELRHSMEFFLLSLFVFLGSVGSYLNLFLPTFLIESRLGLDRLAVYSVALTLYMGVLSISAVITRVAVSYYLRSKRLLGEFAACMKRVLPFWAIILILTLFYGRPVIELVFGETYVDAYASLVILLIGLSIAPVSMYFNNILIARGFTRAYALVSLCALAVNLVTVLSLIGGRGIISAALGMVASLVALALLSVYACYRTGAQSRQDLAD